MAQNQSDNLWESLLRDSTKNIEATTNLKIENSSTLLLLCDDNNARNFFLKNIFISTKNSCFNNNWFVNSVCKII